MQGFSWSLYSALVRPVAVRPEPSIPTVSNWGRWDERFLAFPIGNCAAGISHGPPMGILAKTPGLSIPCRSSQSAQRTHPEGHEERRAGYGGAVVSGGHPSPDLVSLSRLLELAFSTGSKWGRWGGRSPRAPSGNDGNRIPHEPQIGILAEAPRLTILPMLAIVSEVKTTEVESLRPAQPASPAQPVPSETRWLRSSLLPRAFAPVSLTWLAALRYF